MRPIQDNEELILPENSEHSCSQCGLWAKGAHDLDRVFGFRRHAYAPRKDKSIRVDVMPWCKKCRSYPKQKLKPSEDFDSIKGKFPGAVYVIFCPDQEACKIGYSQSHPAGRLQTARRWSMFDLTLIGFYPSDYFGETEAHAQLHDLHIRGEWFHMSAGEAREFILANSGYLEAS